MSTQGLKDIKIVTFSESKLQGLSRTLRRGLGVAGAGAAVAAADQMPQEESDD